jgi:hypothetical protein
MLAGWDFENIGLKWWCNLPLQKKLIYRSQFWVKCLKKKMVCLYILDEPSYVVSRADDGDGSPKENWESIFDEIHQKWWSANLAGHHFCKGGVLRFSTRQHRGFLYRSPICLKIFKWRIHMYGSANPKICRNQRWDVHTQCPSKIFCKGRLMPLTTGFDNTSAWFQISSRFWRHSCTSSAQQY